MQHPRAKVDTVLNCTATIYKTLYSMLEVVGFACYGGDVAT